MKYSGPEIHVLYPSTLQHPADFLKARGTDGTLGERDCPALWMKRDRATAIVWETARLYACSEFWKSSGKTWFYVVGEVAHFQNEMSNINDFAKNSVICR
jgi:hypothetical protein